jgi:hypothetical protein
LEKKERGPLKRVYVRWIRKSFEFLRDRDVELELKGVFEENPWFDVLHYLGIQRIYVSPEKLELGKLYGDFPKKRPVFSKVLSEVLTQALQGSYPEKQVRLIQTAIAVIKGDPESLPKGKPQSFAEKWLREELVNSKEV